MVESSLRLFGLDNALRRELVEGSPEVHAVPGYGAIQIGRHEFCHWENGVGDSWSGEPERLSAMPHQLLASPG